MEDLYINVPWMRYAEQEIGTCAIPGPGSHARILQYYREAVDRDFLSGTFGDHVPWCAAFVGAMLARSGNPGSGSLLARSYLTWGECADLSYGAIAVFPRGQSWQGHVGFVFQHDGVRVRILGGNQSNCVSQKWFPVHRALGFRLPTRINYDGSQSEFVDY